MTRRTRDVIDQARADILALLDEDGPLKEWEVVARALGYPTVAALHQAWPVTEIDHAIRDLQYLRRKGHAVDRWSNERHAWVWRLSTDTAVDVEGDRREVVRMTAGWEEVR